MEWLVFTASFSANTSSSRRVALWRQLKQLGAISPAGSVQVLPATRACQDALHQLTREIEDAGGSALTMRVTAFEGMSDAELIAAFRENRERDYLRIEKALAKLEQATTQRARSSRQARLADALACAWLIRRFIDPNALIRYADKARPNEVAFDLDEGEFAHHADQCAFERMAFAFHLTSPVLNAIGQIVHQLDFGDGRFKRAEIPGIAAILKGWALIPHLSDLELEARGRILFEGVYAGLLY